MNRFKTLFNLKEEYNIETSYTDAKSERDFIRLFNLGNTHLEKNELDKAIGSYEEALKIKEDESARFKLELALIKQKRETQKEAKKDQKKNNISKQEKTDDIVDSNKDKKSKKKDDEK